MVNKLVTLKKLDYKCICGKVYNIDKLVKKRDRDVLFFEFNIDCSCDILYYVYISSHRVNIVNYENTNNTLLLFRETYEW